MVRVGILGFGFMGKTHFNNYTMINDAEVVAICDIDKEKLSGKGVAGNIGSTEDSIDLSGIDTYTEPEKMLLEADLDAVSITLPTYLHGEYAVKALNAGINVLCEKPMALNSDECDDMIGAAEKNGKILQVGHCIRFWPEYAESKRIVDSGRYGKVKAATFRRLSMTPNWAWDGWILDPQRSGGAILDLHIHDADFVQYLFGMPDSVSVNAASGPKGGFDHACTQYYYPKDMCITAEGGWLMSDSFGFQMSFEIVLEKAVICFDITRDPSFKICPAEGDILIPEVEKGDGWQLELVHFVKSVAGEKVEKIITPTQSRDSVKLIESERRSIVSGEKAQLK